SDSISQQQLSGTFFRDDYVVGRWKGGGTHTGSAFSDLPVGSLPAATGKKIHFSGTSVFRIRNGKVAEEIG
ncbi:MAG: ester cyclase, partial [Nitrosomonas ureae]